jgi:hypothetical protein
VPSNDWIFHLPEVRKPRGRRFMEVFLIAEDVSREDFRTSGLPDFRAVENPII